MVGKSPEGAGKSPALRVRMSVDVAEYRNLLIEIAGPIRLGDSVKGILSKVARRSGLTERRARAIWNGEVKDIRGQELMGLLKAAREARELEAARDERQQLLARIAACEAALGLHSSDEAGAVGSGQSDASR